MYKTIVSNKPLSLIIFATIILGYFCWVTTIFSPLAECINGPLVTYDYGFHFTNVFNTLTYSSHGFRLWGYNPYFSSGVIESISPSSRSIALVVFFLKWLPDHLAYNISIFVIIFSIPLLIMVGAYQFYKSFKTGINAFILSALFLFGSAIGREFIYIGHVGFILSIALCLCCAGFLWRYLEEFKPIHLFFHALCASFAIWSHVLSSIVLLSIYAIYLVIMRERISIKIIIKSSIVILTMMLPNLYWLPRFIGYVISRHKNGEMSQFLQSNAPKFIVMLLDPFIIVAIIFASIVFYPQIRDKKTWIFFTCSSLFLLIAIFGTQLGLGDIQPTRFIIPFTMIVLLLLAKANFPTKLLSIASLAIITTITFNNDSLPNSSCGKSNPRFSRLLDYIKKNTLHNERIHIQTSKTLPYYQSRIPSLIPYYTGRSVVSDTYPFPPSFPQYIDDIIFGQQINNELVKKYFDLYNIGHVIVFSDNAKAFFSKSLQFKQVYTDDNIFMYKNLYYSSSYCRNCNASVTIELDKIKVTQATSPVTDLKFHYSRALRISPSSISIEPIKVYDDPIPFIRIRNGNIRKFEVYVSLDGTGMF